MKQEEYMFEGFCNWLRETPLNCFIATAIFVVSVVVAVVIIALIVDVAKSFGYKSRHIFCVFTYLGVPVVFFVFLFTNPLLIIFIPIPCAIIYSANCYQTKNKMKPDILFS
jgi:hypothetical protein